MRWVFLSCFVALGACNTPGPGYRGVAPVRVEVGGSTFDIRVKGRRAQAMRINMEWAMRLASVGPRAIWAIEAVSGCKVDRLTGDQALMEATLDCGSGAPRPPRNAPELLCELDEVEGDYGLLYCTPLRPPVYPELPRGWGPG